jgi:uncharacterized membrane protein HdeD (DUF308 family)
MAEISRPGDHLLAAFARKWQVLLLRGIAATLFGLFTLVQPGLSLASLAFVFGAYALADGVLSAWTAFRGRPGQPHWGVLLLEGLFGIAIGVITLMNPSVPALALLYYIAIRAIAAGVLEMFLAMQLRREIDNEWRLVLAGLVSVIFGLYLIARPGAGALAALWLIGIFSILVGLLFIFLALKVRGFTQRIQARFV